MLTNRWPPIYPWDISFWGSSIHDILIIGSSSLLSILFPCIISYKHSNLHFLHCTWLGCIRSYTEDLSHRFLVNRWLVYNRFMDLDNPLEVIVHYLIIRGKIGLSYWDQFPMVSALVCMVTHWIEPIVNHDLRLSSSRYFIKLLHCVISQHWENIELVLKIAVILTYGWDHKQIIYSVWIESLLMKTGSNRYFQ